MTREIREIPDYSGPAFADVMDAAEAAGVSPLSRGWDPLMNAIIDYGSAQRRETFETYNPECRGKAGPLTSAASLRSRAPVVASVRSDQRGIALQTVIIVVVLVAIAGAVAAVLLGRTAELTGQLESGDATAAIVDSEPECEAFTMNGGGKSVVGVWGDSTGCTWVEATANDLTVTRGACYLIGGTFSTAGDKDKCVAK